uniref:CX domain-containing protein n=1 Tax=Strongyloides stercoralis TaxID=6248 RepID=A0A0K0ES73_STRER
MINSLINAKQYLVATIIALLNIQILAIWDDMVPFNKNLPRPLTYDDKNFGQWCRNFTTNQHVQCPEASPIHWYVCCGPSGTDCCFGLQTHIYVLGGGFVLVLFIIALYSLYLQLQISRKLKKTTKIDSLKYYSVKPQNCI